MRLVLFFQDHHAEGCPRSGLAVERDLDLVDHPREAEQVWWTRGSSLSGSPTK
jgi:hypothetical protein